jgi:hypothetical protein
MGSDVKPVNQSEASIWLQYGQSTGGGGVRRGCGVNYVELLVPTILIIIWKKELTTAGAVYHLPYNKEILIAVSNLYLSSKNMAVA